jgi:hypothetical protein
MLNRLLPKQVDNRFAGNRAAAWLLGLFIGLKLVMSLNSIVNTASVASGADGIPLDSYGPAAAREVLLLFSLLSLGQLMLAVIALTVLVRYRALVPFMYVVLLAEHVGRRLIIQSYTVEHVGPRAAGSYVNLALLALLTLGLVLSLWVRPGHEGAHENGRQG